MADRFFNRVSRATKVLFGKELVNTTASGIDNEYVNNLIADIMTIDNSRKKKYDDYIYMDDNYGQEVSSSLDANADMTLRRDEIPFDKVLRVNSSKKFIINYIESLIEYLDLEYILWSYARSLSKFGDLFVEIIWNTNSSLDKYSNIVGLQPLPAKTISYNFKNGSINREEPYKQEINGKLITTFKPWQIIHFGLFREPTDDYGTSDLKSARLPFRQLNAMESTLCISRLKKPSFRLHKIDTTNKSIPQAKEAINEYKTNFRKRVWINPNTQKIEIQDNSLMANDDIFMGVNKDNKNVGIDLIEGKAEIDIKDILYFREKLLTSLKTPQHRMNITSVGTTNKAISNDQGLYYSASIQRIQLALIRGLRFLFNLGLVVRGVDVRDEKNSYVVSLPKQRTVDELVDARVKLIRSTVAKNYKEIGILSKGTIMRDVIGMSEIQISKNKKEIDSEAMDGDKDTTNKDKDKDNNGNGNSDKDNGTKGKSNFNKSGNGSAPVRLPNKESLLEDMTIKRVIEDVEALIKDDGVNTVRNKKDMSVINSIQDSLKISE